MRFVSEHGSVVEYLNLVLRILGEVLGLITLFIVRRNVFIARLPPSRAAPWRDIVREVRINSQKNDL